jgi:signal transduction histidine kinase
MDSMDSANSKDSPVKTRTRPDTNVWVKWYWWSHYALYGFLALTTAMALLAAPSWETRAVEFTVAGLFAVWHWYFQGRSPEWFYSHLGIRVSYLVGVIAFFIVLISLQESYWMLAFIVFWQIWITGSVAWSGGISFALTLILLGINGVPLTGSAGYLNLGLVSIVATTSILLGLYISSLIGQSEERQRLIKELEKTRAELAAEERRAGILEERGRLAREIHDTLAQGFISIVTHLEAAEESETDSRESRRHVEQAKQTSRENLAEARRLVAALRPEILEIYSLPEALRRLTARTSEDLGIPAELNVTGDPDDTPQELQVTLLRAAQEALANARRHAKADRIDLTLSYAGDLILLDVQDDGVGFDPTFPEDDGNGGSGGFGGFGLRSIRERVEALGGELLIESEPGAGTTLAVQLPWRATELAETVETVRDPVEP